MLRARCDKAPHNTRAKATPVFPAVMGGLRDPSNTQADLRDAFRAAGYPWLTRHSLRKTTAIYASVGLTYGRPDIAPGTQRGGLSIALIPGSGVLSEPLGHRDAGQLKIIRGALQTLCASRICRLRMCSPE
jgi:hypothetical protein